MDYVSIVGDVFTVVGIFGGIVAVVGLIVWFLSSWDFSY